MTQHHYIAYLHFLYGSKKKSIKYSLNLLTDYCLAWKLPHPVKFLEFSGEFYFFNNFYKKITAYSYFMLTDYDGQKRDVYSVKFW